MKRLNPELISHLIVIAVLISSVFMLGNSVQANTMETKSKNMDTKSKIVTAGGTVTEIVFALGAGSRVVAVDQSSSYPAQARTLPQVGYYRDLAAEGILSFAPTKLLTIEGAGRDEVIKQIKDTGVEVIIYPKATNVEGLARLIKAIAKDLSLPRAGDELVQNVMKSLPEPAANQYGRAVFLLSAGGRGLIAAGTETVPNLIFEYVGLENLTNEHVGFKSVGIESLVVSQPDFLIAPYHVVMGAGGKEKFCQQSTLALLEAAQKCQLLIMDSLLALGMTPRLAEAMSTVDEYRRTL